MGFEERITKRLEKKKSKEIDPTEFRERYSPEKEKFMKPYDDLVKEKMKAYGEFYDYEESVRADLESQKGKIEEGATKLAEAEKAKKGKKEFDKDYSKELKKEIEEAEVERLRMMEVVNKIKEAFRKIKKIKKEIAIEEVRLNKLNLEKNTEQKDLNKEVADWEKELKEIGQEMGEEVKKLEEEIEEEDIKEKETEEDERKAQADKTSKLIRISELEEKIKELRSQDTKKKDQVSDEPKSKQEEIKEKIKDVQERIKKLESQDTKKRDQVNKGITNKEGEIKNELEKIDELKRKYKKRRLEEVENKQKEAVEKLDSEIEKLAELEGADADTKERREIEKRVQDLILEGEELTLPEGTKVDERERDKIKKKMEDLGDEIKTLKEKEEKLQGSSFGNLIEETEEEYTKLKTAQIKLPDYDFLKTEAKRKEKQGREEQKRLRKTTKEFRRMKKRGVTVEDLKETAKISSGTISKFYDTQERINSQIEREQKTRLFGEIVAGSAQIAFYSAKGIMAAPILELGKGVRYNIAENISLGLYRIRSASRGLLFKKGPLAIGEGTWKISSVEETKKQVKKYKTPEDVPDPDKTNKEIIEGFKKSMDESTEKVLKSIDNPPELASETADRVFKHMAEAYKFYVDSGTDDEEGVNKLFKTMREAGLKPEIFKKESANLKQLIVKIEEWTKKVDEMSKEEAEQDLGVFWNTVVGAATGKDLGRADIVKKLAENIYIGFLLNEKLQKGS